MCQNLIKHETLINFKNRNLHKTVLKFAMLSCVIELLKRKCQEGIAKVEVYACIIR